MISDLPTLETALVTLIVATIRTLLESSPTILGGVVVAAWLRTQATPEKVASIFCGEGIHGWLRTVLVGMALPVCSIGIFPVLGELRRLGLSTSKLICLAISVPLLNPFSLLFGLTVLSFPLYLIMIVAAGSLAVVVAAVSDRFAFRNEDNAAPRPVGLTGRTRMRNLFVAASRIVTGPTIIALIVTVMITGLTVIFISEGAFYILCESKNHFAPAISSLLSITQYVSPSRAIVQFGGIEDANLDTATGLGIYLCGTSICGTTMLVAFWRFGWRRFLSMMIAFFLFIGTAIYLSKFVLPNPVVEVAETDTLNNLMRPNYATFQQFGKCLGESLTFLNSFMYFGSAATLLLIVAGLVVRVLKIDFLDDDPEEAASQNEARMSKSLSASQLGSAAIALVGVFFFVSAFMFFPSPKEVMQEMDRLQTDTGIEVEFGNITAAVDRLVAWDSAAASVPIGAAIRGSFPTPVQRELTRDLRTELRNMRSLLVEGDVSTAKDRLPQLRKRLSEIKTAFTGEAK